MSDTSLHLITAWGPAVVLLFAGGWLLRPALRRWRRERRMLRILHRLGPEIRRDVVLDNGIDGLAFIDFAVLTPTGIAIVDYLPYHGAIFGAGNADQWAQVIGRQTTRFPNPLERNREHLSAARYNFEKMPLRGLVLFGPEASFPKGRPEGVVVPAELPQEPPPLSAVPEALRNAWAGLTELAERNAERYREELALSRTGEGRARAAAGWLLVAAAVLWGAAAAAGLWMA